MTYIFDTAVIPNGEKANLFAFNIHQTLYLQNNNLCRRRKHNYM
jgi:hypothetical protein